MINNQIPQTNTSEIFSQFRNDIWSKPMKPVSNNTNTNILQNIQNSEKKVEVQPKTNAVEQDTFVKEDKKNDKKKVAKYVAIGTGVAALVYSAFALIKYRRRYLNVGEKLAEPIKTLAARINPNRFKPSVAIEDNDMTFIGEVSLHLVRLKNPEKQKKYAQHLLETLSLTEEGRQKFIRHFGDLLNQQ